MYYFIYYYIIYQYHNKIKDSRSRLVEVLFKYTFNLLVINNVQRRHFAQQSMMGVVVLTSFHVR